MRTLLTRAGLLSDDAKRAFEICDPIIAGYLPPPIQIHHVSDLHFGAKTAQVDIKHGSDGEQGMARALGHGPLRDEYLHHLAHRPMGLRPHLLVVSGDWAEWGRDEEFAEARAWLERVEALLAPHPELGTDEPRVLLVGGNHDVDWNLTRGPAGVRNRHRGFAKAFVDKVQWIRPHLDCTPENRSHSAHVRYPDAGLAFVLWGSAEYGGQIDEHVVQFVDSIREQAVRARDGKIQADADALNRRFGKTDPGLVHTSDLQRLRQAHLPDPIRIAVFHHPISPIPTSSEVAPFAGLVNAGEVKDVLLEQGFTLVLHGHVHTPWIGTESWPGRHDGRGLTIVSAGTLGSEETYEKHGFNELRIVREGQTRWVEIDIFSRHGQGFEATSDPVKITIAPVARGFV